MKKVLAWAKSNPIVVIAVLAIVVALPASYVFSSGWNKKIVEAEKKRVSAEESKVKSKELSYTIQAVLPGQEPVRVKAAPNEKLIEWFAQQIEAEQAQAQSVADAGEAFNRQGRMPLVEGLFPEPADADAKQLKPVDFIRALEGGPGVPSAYEKVLEAIGAGMPREPDLIQARLEDERTRMVNDLERQRGPGPLTPDEEEKLTTELSSRRIGEAQRDARKTTVFCDPVTIADAVGPPLSGLANKPSLDLLFRYQWNLWMVEELLNGIKEANTDDRGRPTRVEDSIVKRIKSIALDSIKFSGDDLIRDRPSVSSRDGLVGTSKTWSLTGRVSNPGNQLYDVRQARLSLIVDAARLPELIAAIQSSNFMAVLDVDLESVDPWDELKEGFWYGPTHVVEADLTVEVIFLRSWMSPLMPARVRDALGVQEQRG